MEGPWERRFWERRGFLEWLVWVLALPLAFFYCLAIQVRNLFYNLGWLPAKRLPSPVLSVGNLTVGGTGKTPTTLWLANALTQRGYRVAILTRGYKGKRREPLVLEPGSAQTTSFKPEENSPAVGDEALMMARLFGHKVGVGKRRYEVGRLMLRNGPVDVFILDDGFQHRQLQRDLDLLLLGTLSNGWLLPAGPFRESKSALKRADLYLVTGSRERWERFLNSSPKDNIFFGSLQPKALLSFQPDRCRELPVSLLAGRKIVTVAAIADAFSFYRMIHEWEGEIVDAFEFPDHHAYSTQDWQNINRSGRQADLIVTTEKDLVKLMRFPFAREKLLALRVEMVIENSGALRRALEEAIRAARV